MIYNDVNDFNFSVKFIDLKFLFKINVFCYVLVIVLDWLLIVVIIIVCSYYFIWYIYLLVILIIGVCMYVLVILMYDVFYY